MQIISVAHDDLLELRVSGRLDAEWAATLQKAIDHAIREGYHAVVLDLSELAYVSSAGLSVLVHAHRQFQQIRGFFGVGQGNCPAQEIIQLTGLDKLLLCDLEAVRRSRGGGRSTLQLPSRVAASDRADFEIYELESGAEFKWDVLGDPTKFDHEVYTASDVTELAFTDATTAIGVGAFGTNFQTCAAQFGELLAVAGAVATLPANGSGRPDYQLARGDYVPKAQLLHGIRWSGPYRQLLRFDQDERERPLPLSEFVEELTTLTGYGTAACVMLAETTGLVGTSLRKSPTVTARSSSRFDHPEIRDWLSFTPERVFPHSLAVIAGVLTNSPHEPQWSRLAGVLRPLSSQSAAWGHFHAAVFPFRPFKKRRLELEDTLPTLFDSGQLQGLLHLLHDERPITGAGETALSRGAVWIGPLAADKEVRS